NDFSPANRIVRHFRESKTSVENRLGNIFSSDDYGTAQLLIGYARDMNIGDGYIEEEKIIEDNIKRLQTNAKMKLDDFIGTLELAESYGQIDNTIEDKKEKILRSVNEWYIRCDESHNYGFFGKILDEFNNKIIKEAEKRGESIKKELESFCKDNTETEENEILANRIKKIREMIENQNYTVAEDLIRRLSNDEAETEIEQLNEDFLSEFVEQYDYNYKLVCNQREKLEKAVMISNRSRKETKHGRKMIENWLYSGHMGETKLFNLLMAMGFSVGTIEKKEKIGGKLETYDVYIQRAQNGRKNNYKHPISAFGSRAIENGFRVICLYGKYDANALIDTFKEIGSSKHCIALLDFSLTLDERRRLARKVKSEMPEKIFGVIDRVMLIYLANNAKETSVNRMLMSVMMPYAYYQPYVISSTDTMPPEMFMGRKDELNKIESPEGVNIVYGGRQLGKSALLKMAKNDINMDENGDRAVLVDIKGLDYKKAAKKISSQLHLEHIFAENKVTDDWDELAMNIKERLMDEKQKIPYLLLLIDEADIFIESCEDVNFKPFDALKDIQSIGQGRFKFVIAGLRNIVRFNRNVALGNNSVLTHLSSITIKPFNAMEAKELLEIPLFYLGLRFPKENDALVSTILATTNYFPGLIQLYCMKLLEAMKKPDYAGYNEADTPPYNVMEKHIKRVLSESGFQQSIREKFMITLKVDADDFYYVIALLAAYLYHENNSEDGYSPADIKQVAEEFGIAKIEKLDEEKVNALMEEMSELNIFRITASGKYLFTRYSFFQMMGTKNNIEDEMEKYME
ncbi:MAG: hypothetical protein SOZ28_03340, partial [Clostridia bacterium]|nr:hypothetical protein [Clostridia bacterium]